MTKQMPGFIKPELATLRSKAPVGPWLNEIKYDGYRIQLHTNRGHKTAYTRNGYDWTKRFSLIAGSLSGPSQAIVDGEVVVINEGRTNFSELQADLAKGSQDRLLYYAFDILWLNGKDLRKASQVERKAILKEVFKTYELQPPLLYSEHVVGNGQQLFKQASELNYEGIVSKNPDAPYRSGRRPG